MSAPPSTILPPRLLAKDPNSDNGVEVSVHSLPKQLMREFRHVFGDKYLANNNDAGAELLAIPTNQHAKEDLVAIGDHIEAEKDRLLNVFITLAADLCQRIRSRGYWADYIDPCSGLPMLTLDCNKVYSEVDGMECLLQYKSYNAGFCKILTHPQWGSAVYPATMFTHAPKQVILELISQYPAAAK